MSTWDKEVDLLIVGSGAAGMAAAMRGHDLGSEVLVLERSDKYGGSTAMSGGVCWVGNHPKMGAVGIPDNRDDAVTYLKHITGGSVPSERLEAYLDSASRMLTYFDENTAVRYDPLVKYTDYYPEAPGGRPGGRSMEARPFDGRKLGTELASLRLPHPQSQILGKFGITAKQAHGLLSGSFKSKLLMMWLMLKYSFRFMRRKKFGRDTYLTCGNALAGRLRQCLLDRSIALWLESAATELVIEEGRVVGAVVQRGSETLRIGARQGVLLGAGGFSRNQTMRDQYQAQPITTAWTAGNPHDMGDGIKMGLAAGAGLDLMDEAWWTPTTLVPKSDLAWVLVVEKNLPGSIFVNRHGNRFANEAAPYIDVVHKMYEDDAKTSAAIPCWMVFDATFRHRYPVGPVAPGYAMPDSRTPRRYRDGFLKRAKSLDELAGLIEVPAAALVASVERFNGFCKTGKDDDFGRGDSASDRYYGDEAPGYANPCLGPLVKAPYYAIQVYAGDLGTKGGLTTDSAARVLREDGTAIPGLYAAGNTTASVMGRTYPGAGGTIGPALAFGFVAAETALADVAEADKARREKWAKPAAATPAGDVSAA